MKFQIPFIAWTYFEAIAIACTYKRSGKHHCKFCRKKMEPGKPLRNHNRDCPFSNVLPEYSAGAKFHRPPPLPPGFIQLENKIRKSVMPKEFKPTKKTKEIQKGIPKKSTTLFPVPNEIFDWMNQKPRRKHERRN